MKLARKWISKFLPLTEHRAIIFTTTTRTLGRSEKQKELALKRFQESREGTRQYIHKFGPINNMLKKLRAMNQTPDAAKTIRPPAYIIRRIITSTLRINIKLIVILLLISAITQTHAARTHHTWNRQDMLGDNLGPGLHPHTFRITSTNIGGGMFSNLAAASVPTTQSDPPPTPIIENKDTKRKKKSIKKDRDTKFIPAHKFTAAMQQQDDLNTNNSTIPGGIRKI
jgi:hypothetical protein